MDKRKESDTAEEHSILTSDPTPSKNIETKGIATQSVLGSEPQPPRRPCPPNFKKASKKSAGAGINPHAKLQVLLESFESLQRSQKPTAQDFIVGNEDDKFLVLPGTSRENDDLGRVRIAHR